MKHTLIIALAFIASITTAQVKFSELPAATTVSSSDKFIILQGTGTGSNKTATGTVLDTWISGTYVPKTLTINSHALSADISLNAADIGITTSTGGNGAADSGAYVLFGASGQLTATTATNVTNSDGTLTMRTLPSSIEMVDSSNGFTGAFSFPSLTTNVSWTLPNATGTLLLTTGSGSALTSLNASNISSGTLAGARLPSFTGDVTNSAAALTLATVNSNVGTFTNASVTVNAKGLVTAVSNGSTPIGGSTGATTNAILKANGTGGSTLQTSGITIDSTDAITTSGAITRIRNGTTAQSFEVYDTYTNASNYSRLESLWAGGQMYLRTVGAGTGGSGSNLTVSSGGGILSLQGGSYLTVAVGGTTKMLFASDGLIAQTDNTYTFGRTGASRFSTAYLGTSVVVPVVNYTPATAPASPTSGWVIYCDSGDSNKLKAKASTGTIVLLGTP
jgi:hypothetical protein